MPMPTCLEILRGRRDMLLRESDWTQFPDSPLTDAKKAEWATYRQELRDLPAVNPSPTWQESYDINGNRTPDNDKYKLPDITWGTKPE